MSRRGSVAMHLMAEPRTATSTPLYRALFDSSKVVLLKQSKHVENNLVSFFFVISLEILP